jgi:transglutaminase-like putative cysteine protease
VSSVAQPATAGHGVGGRGPADARTRADAHAPADAGAATVRLAVFACFAVYAAFHWANLLADPSLGTVAALALPAVACGAALALLDRSPLDGWRAVLLAALAVAVALAAALLAIGVEPRLLVPWGWGELADLLDHALVGVQGVDWPYDGPDEWVRRTILLGAPLLLVAAAALAFWPAAREARPPLRGAGLVLVIATYAIAVTTNDPGRPLLYGALLLALIAAWLWLPRMGRRERAAGAAAVVAATLVALPVAGMLDGDRPWFDYRSWSPFGADTGIAFDWSHQYGPLDWPRQGSTLLTVRSDEPHFWKAQTLDRFDGLRWYRAPGDDDRDLAAELPFPRNAPVSTGDWTYGEPNSDWTHEFEVTVRSLSTDLLIGAGLPYDVNGVAAALSADGTAELIGDALERGESYTVRAYEPAPTPTQMDGAPRRYPAWAERYTALTLPPGPGSTSAETVAVPPRDYRVRPGERAAADRLLSDSVYGDTYALAQTLTLGSGSAYAAVDAIADHLRTSYTYDEQVPERRYPLESFLFEDRRGYCQQFSGAMALMLRMLGIPARVVAGFSPGTLNRNTDEYRVRDLDAHSWVEVYFAGIGWVPFDPTPHAEDAAAARPASSSAAAAAGDDSAGEVSQEPADSRPAASDGADETSDRGTIAASGRDGSPGGLGPALLAAAGLIGAIALALGCLFWVRVRRWRALDRERLAEAEIAELRDALDRLGWEVSPATTLLALERQLAATAGDAAAGYARALRSFRFDPVGGNPPDPAARRALRRALSPTAGRLGRLRTLLAIPPGGPSPSP